MIARIVKLKCITGMEDQLTQVGQNKLVQLNIEAGCIGVHFLEPSDVNENPYFGVISIWQDQQMLNALKKNREYCSLQSEIAPLLESVTEEIYFISTDQGKQ